MIYLLSNVYKWTLTLLTVESSLGAVAILFLFGQPVCYALIKDGGKNHESAYCNKILQKADEIGKKTFTFNRQNY